MEAYLDTPPQGNKQIILGGQLFDAGAKAERVKMASILDKLNNAGDGEPIWFDPTCRSPTQPCE